MSQAERRTLQDFWATQPEDTNVVDIVLDNFFDVNDEANPDRLDRAVIVTYDPETNISYGGGVLISDPQDKGYFREAWNSRNVQAYLYRPANGNLPTLKKEQKEADA